MLANVLALVFVVIGLVALVNLPSSQYPNVVPPTVQVTTRYPGASAMTLVDTVALPIEQNVNGVENMIYMQSTNASDGTYTLIGHLRDRHESGRGRDPGAEPCGRGDFVAAAGSSAPGRDDEEEVDVDPRVRRPDLPRQSLRFPVPVELRRHQCARRAAPPPRRRRRDRARHRSIRHAHMAGPESSAGARTDSARCDQRHPAAEPGSGGRTDRRAARAERPGLSIYARPQGPARRSEGVREYHRQGRFGQRRPHHQDTRRRARRARRADL